MRRRERQPEIPRPRGQRLETRTEDPRQCTGGRCQEEPEKRPACRHAQCHAQSFARRLELPGKKHPYESHEKGQGHPPCRRALYGWVSHTSWGPATGSTYVPTTPVTRRSIGIVRLGMGSRQGES